MSKRKFSLLRRREEFQNHYTAIDIGTEVVKALVVKREGDRGIVIGVGKVRQGLTDMQAGAVADIQAVIDNVDKALTEAEDMCQVVPGQAVMGIAGEQIKGFSTSVSVPRQQPQSRITQAEVASALQAVQRRALREAVRQMSAEMGVAEVNVKLVHSAITSVHVDGYAVSNPLNFQGRVLDITVFNTFAPLTHVGALQTIAHELDLELVATVAEPYAMARGCATDEIYEFGGIFIDVGGGTTDVAVVRNGGIEATRMFALGGRAFTRRVATELSMSLEQAEQFKIAHGENRLPADQRILAHNAVRPNAEVLAQGVALSLEEMAHGEMLPPAIYLAGGGAALPEVAEQLEALEWTEYLPFSKTPAVRVLRPDDVRGIYDSTSLLTGTQDITPMGLAYHAVQLDDEDDQPLGGVMRRLMKAMKV
ncbi:MAG TPA: cell division FtsA domain-containing protein [Candidatus Dormibacteraeota bacterium]|jgi:cell division protein FtsA|nr:cell division FtsA domain-containing protein [Candidatus Dormibacteraeota bacterium]